MSQYSIVHYERKLEIWRSVVQTVAKCAELDVLFTNMAFFIWIFAAAIIAYFVYDSFRKSQYWPRKGIPTLTPIPLFGSLIDEVATGQGEFDLKWTKKLGRTFGYFDGPTPVLVTSDLDMLKNIMVKDFTHFANRRDMGLNGPIIELALIELRDQHWKDMRGVLVPAFTSGKLKQMNSLIQECCSDLLKNLETLATTGEEFAAKELFGRLTLDVIATAFFGTKINSQEEPNSGFVRNARKVFDFSRAYVPLLFAVLFPKLQPLMRRMGIQNIDKAAVQFFVDNTEQIIRLRKESKQTRRDFLQMMLSSLKSDTHEKPAHRDTTTVVHNDTDADVASSAMVLSGTQDKPLSHSNYKLSMLELAAQSTTFFLAGYETTSTAITFMAYCMAVHPDIQERLRAEVQTVLAGKDVIEYDDLAAMHYMDQCVNETLRLYPPFSRTDRHCNEDWTYDGVEYKKGTVIGVPILVVHRDPEYWPEPEVYNPERFSKENKGNIKPYSFLAFGQGPRNCIGMRFAYYEIKMVMASILKKYRIVRSPKTQVPLVLKDDIVFMSTERGVWLKVEKL
ncbi:cytochrome P450 3A2-like isoform X2 [Paramacrobiotus metropolitanus]|uniref:cytochrome P450 3A2-like isoform X2 n=1 Tax=Paramacrobiotus metropolitanus TaxID=2943436 RepID=UPI0024460D2C|nr:cytochrome P450 3A2-like isoform X2 [Paramacrobiotus metropolitanus]